MTAPSALDRPIILAELLGPAALAEVIQSAAALLGGAVALVDPVGSVVCQIGEPVEPLHREPLMHEGSAIGAVWISATPDAPRQARHLVQLLGVVVEAVHARFLVAELHSAAIAATYGELREKNERLAAAVERMQESERLKSTFLSTVSHELRTPLTSVIGYSEMLLEGIAGPLAPEQRDYVQIIMEKGDQLLQLITGLLDVSRLDASGPYIARETVSVVDLIGGVLTALAPLARRKRVELRLDGLVDPPRVDGDREKLRQVLFNLIGNAVKFSPDGGRVGIAIAMGPLMPDDEAMLHTHAARGLRLSVSDSGIGIAADKQSRIFEPFFQVDSSSTREYGGTGLGLALVKRFVEAHGGRVWVESALGRGSVFTITLPALSEDRAE